MRSSENHSANNTTISTSNRCQELSKNDDIENENNTRDCIKPTKAAESNKIILGKKYNLTQEKSRNPTIYRLKNTQQHVKKYDNVTVVLGDSVFKDLRGWELLNDKQKVVVKSFRGARNEPHALAC